MTRGFEEIGPGPVETGPVETVMGEKPLSRRRFLLVTLCGGAMMTLPVRAAVAISTGGGETTRSAGALDEEGGFSPDLRIVAAENLIVLPVS
ncbi:hypothetical protein [Salinicola rhizosphaerae]|uniref:Uncharacterized protein n=1 Tax=Salinicola rhizosphaerae TaxID=1443141 RepID=A0ABQ3DRJ5_9GAMM|nr:hypothetical protein [Salinicola rhizosphaerae]GHB09832.1 hypothetical protein GCM10009038_04340 [Salinicola rhizosphaerae]